MIVKVLCVCKSACFCLLRSDGVARVCLSVSDIDLDRESMSCRIYTSTHIEMFAANYERKHLNIHRHTRKSPAKPVAQ